MSNPSSSASVVGGLIVLAFWSARVSAGELQNLLDKSDAFAALPRVKHIPAFRLEPIQPAEHAKGTDWSYVCDGDERIGLIQTWSKEIEMFRFSPQVAKGAKYEIPKIYHWGNLYGARIQMYGTQMLPPTTSFKLSFAKDRGDSLELAVEHRHRGDVSGSSEYRLGWDERLGYVWNCTSRYSMPKPAKIEFNNLLAGGISESRNSHKRWQKTVRAAADGRITFAYHNPTNIPVDDIRAGGFVGFVTEEQMNPFVELIETSSPVSVVTCSQWYDQHIVMKPPEAKEAEGLYHARARYRFLSLPGKVAREIEAAAVPSVTEDKWKPLGFLLNRPSDFEQFIPFDRVYNGGVWQHVTRSDEQAHAGKYSLKVGGRGTGKVAAFAPIGGGPGVIGESKKRYRLTAWVKTDLSEGTAYLRVDDARWNWDDIQASRKTKELSGQTDWTRLAVEFQPGPDDPFLVVRICVDGHGAAWFDDVMLEEAKD